MEPRAELYLHLIPLKNTDHKRVSRQKNNPLQRIKVSDNATLRTITSYLIRLANAESNNTAVTLYTTYRGEPVQVPLSMSVAEFLLITNQAGQGEVRYSFSEIQPKVDARIAVPTAQARPPPERPRYPPPQGLGRLAPPLPVDSFGPDFHTGFSLFSNSFGGFLPSLDSGTLGQPTDVKDADTISLRKNLELEIQRK
jgi:hypothetical protein